MWLVATYFLHVVGEMCLSPVGLSTVTKLAPERATSLMMGVWFLASAVGNYLGGRAASLYETLELPTLFGIVAAVINVILTLIGTVVLYLILHQVPTVRDYFRFIADWEAAQAPGTAVAIKRIYDWEDYPTAPIGSPHSTQLPYSLLRKRLSASSI